MALPLPPLERLYTIHTSYYALTNDYGFEAINTRIHPSGRFYVLFQNLQNKFQVQESRISLDTMQSIIYRQIKYILYIADKPWWVLHMYSMYVNFYIQSFLHIQKKPCFYFSLYIFIFIYIYLYLYIDFSYTPH